MTYDLPTTVDVNGIQYEVRTDYRAILDICAALSDVELSDQERAYVVLEVFYPGLEEMPADDYNEAISACFRFINCGEEEDRRRRSPKLVDWEQDFQYIVAPVNRVAGQEIRALPYMHWWTFVAYYNEIGGDCTFAMIVRIRDKQSRHKKLDADEKEWLKRNREKVEFKKKYTEAEMNMVEEWLYGGQQRDPDPDADNG